jgi:hypothetical protein
MRAMQGQQEVQSMRWKRQDAEWKMPLLQWYEEVPFLFGHR